MRRMSRFWLIVLLVSASGHAAVFAAPVPRLAEAEVDLAEGLSALDAKDYPAAVDWLGKAAALDPDEGTPRYWRGFALLRLGRAREAAAEIEASLAARRPPEVDRERVLTDLAAARKSAEGEPRAVEPPQWRPSAEAIDDRG